MAGGKRQRGNHEGGHFKKKPKHSKQFWKQRKTVGVAPIPQNDSSDENYSSSVEENEEETKTHFEKLLSAFSSGKNCQKSVGSSDEDESQSDDDSDDSDAEDENGAIEDEEVSEGDVEVDSEEEDSEPETDAQAEEDEEEGSDEEPEEEEIEVNDLEASDDGSSDEDDEEESSNSDLCGSAKDPFVARHELKIEDSLVEVVKSRKFEIDIVRWKKMGRISVAMPDWTPERKEKVQNKKLVDDDDEEDNDDIRNSQIDLIVKPVEPSLNDSKLEKQFVKAQLTKNIAQANVKNLTDSKHQFTSFQQELFSVLNSYRDLNFTDRSHDNGEEIRLVYALHALNHILKTRTRIINNNARLSKSIKENNKKLAENASLRDQGLVRPKVLIILPFRESARRVVEFMIKLLFSKDSNRGTVMKKKRFDEEFGSSDAIDGELPVANGRKPEDYYKTFAGNTDDSFKLGIAVTKKSLKLFTDFYSSDMVIASPLGLRMVLENDADFLASVELLIMDQVEIFSMQNWEHVTFLMEKLHQRPTKTHGVDFSRVRLWTLDELSPLYCQSLFFSSVPMVELNAIFNRSCKNYLGKMVTVNPVKSGSISSVLVSGVPMTFHRVDTKTLATSVDDRFNYFVQKVMPEFKKDLMYHTLIFVPSYFDFVRLRNWFQKSDLDFGDVCEYTKDKRIAEYRDQFFHGEKHFLIYTERSHFYRRFAIKGIRHLIFYQLPQNPEFFSELCNFMQPAFLNRKGGSDGNMSCTVLYTKYDNLRLASVASTSKAEFMINAEKNIHLFMAGNS